MKTVKKVIIPVAGFGTRFLPATKAMPKEMLPIIDKPVIQYVILVTSHAKRPVEDHFDDNQELEAWLHQTGKDRQLEEIRAIGKLANFVYVRQKGPYGNATPIMNCQRLMQMIETFERYGDPVLGVVPVSAEGTRRYGIIDPKAEVEKDVFQLKGMVEKPGPSKAPSRLAATGAYVLTPDVFEHIQKMKPGHGGELVLLDAIFGLMKKRPVYARRIEGTWHDTGSKIGWLKANLTMALERTDLKKEVKEMLKDL